MTRTPAQPLAHHIREHVSLLADSERRALIRIAGWLPARINSDHLSSLALLSMLAAGISFASFRVTPWAALGVIVSLIANWFGDSLDGTVARVRGQQRPRYGFYVDHVIDLAGTALLLAGLACSGLMNPTLAATLLAAYLLVAAESYLTTHAAGIFRMSFLGFGPTELRIILAAGTVKVVWSPWIALWGPLEVRLFDLGGIVAIVGLVLAFIVSAVRNTLALSAAEPRPAPADESRAA
jgi:archaetidylinositol phosphate synthase